MALHCAVIDPPSAIYEWRAPEALSFREKVPREGDGRAHALPG
jgi:hypothetical protein